MSVEVSGQLYKMKMYHLSLAIFYLLILPAEISEMYQSGIFRIPFIFYVEIITNFFLFHFRSSSAQKPLGGTRQGSCPCGDGGGHGPWWSSWGEEGVRRTALHSCRSPRRAATWAEGEHGCGPVWDEEGSLVLGVRS